MIKLRDLLKEDKNPCWKGYKQVGMKPGDNGEDVPNCVPEGIEANDEDLSEKNGPCWKGYKQVGMKKGDNGGEVPNCVPEGVEGDTVISEELTPKEKALMYKLTTKALKAVPQSKKQKEIIKQLDKLRKKGNMKALSESVITEAGLFRVRDYLKGIIPPSLMKTTNPQDKERLKAIIQDLVMTLNHFWKQHNIPYRVKESVNEDLRQWFGNGPKGGWSRYNTQGDKVGKCGDAKDGEPYVACLSKEKAQKLGKEGRAKFVKRKRSAQKQAGGAKKGRKQKKGQKPTSVKTGT